MTQSPPPAPTLAADHPQLQAPHLWPAAVVADALAAGCRWVSLREKDLTAAERLALLRRLRALARPVGAVVTVHADLDSAADVDGVHLAAGGDPGAARRRPASRGDAQPFLSQPRAPCCQ